jgi:hypothetical protein
MKLKKYEDVEIATNNFISVLKPLKKLLPQEILYDLPTTYPVKSRD